MFVEVKVIEEKDLNDLNAMQHSIDVIIVDMLARLK